MCSHCHLSTKATLVDWNAATRWSDVVVTKATKLEDKLRAYYVRLDGLAFEERLVEAVDLGLMLLQTLGEKMSRQLTTLQVVRKTMKISRSDASTRYV
jgi:hypothetical protein